MDLNQPQANDRLETTPTPAISSSVPRFNHSTISSENQMKMEDMAQAE